MRHTASRIAIALIAGTAMLATTSVALAGFRSAPDSTSSGTSPDGGYGDWNRDRSCDADGYGGGWDGGGGGGWGGGGDDLMAVGLTADQKLVRFDVDRPSSTQSIGTVSGLQGDTRLVGIDYRVQNNLLYGVGNQGGVYTFGSSGATATKVSQVTVALSGTNFGVDFNPAADRLRVISDNGQNLRHDVNTGTTTTDGPLTYPAVPPAAPTPGVNITGAAYSNNDLDVNTSTTLYDLDTMLDQIVIQAPANSGMLSATGKLQVDAGSDAGFDIYSVIRDGTTVDLCAFAALQVGGKYRLYGITLFTGKAMQLGTFRSGTQVTDIALPLNQI